MTLGDFIRQQEAEAEAAGYPKCSMCDAQLGPQWNDLPVDLAGRPLCGTCALRYPKRVAFKP
jgi:hypothetical protein